MYAAPSHSASRGSGSSYRTEQRQSSCHFGTEVANPNIQAIIRSADETVNLIRHHRIGNHDFLQGIDGEGELAGQGGLVTGAVVRHCRLLVEGPAGRFELISAIALMAGRSKYRWCTRRGAEI